MLFVNNINKIYNHLHQIAHTTPTCYTDIGFMYHCASSPSFIVSLILSTHIANISQSPKPTSTYLVTHVSARIKVRRWVQLMPQIQFIIILM